MKSLKSRIATVQLLEPQNPVATDTASAWLDTRGFNGAVVVVNVGTLTGVDASNYLTPVLQESDTTAAADATTVDAAQVDGAFTKIDATNEDQLRQEVGYRGTKRYVRVNLDYTGAGITASYAAVTGILGRPNVLPAVAPAAVAAT